MKKLVLLSAVTALGFALSATAVEAPVAKVAFFNFQQVMPMPVDENAIKLAPLEWQDGIRKLMGDIQARAKKLEEKGKKLEKMVREVKEKGKLASDAALDSQKEEMQQLDAELKLGSQQLQQYQEEAFGKLQQAFYVKVSNKVHQYAIAHGWDIVTPMALFAKDEFNITDAVVKALDTEYAAEKAEKEKAKKEGSKPAATEKSATTKSAVKAA